MRGEASLIAAIITSTPAADTDVVVSAEEYLTSRTVHIGVRHFNTTHFAHEAVDIERVHRLLLGRHC
jgi:hypothetical protein